MNQFHIKAWIVGADVVAAETATAKIDDPALSPDGAVAVNAIGQGSYINAGDLLSTLTYEGGQLVSTLCEIEVQS